MRGYVPCGSIKDGKERIIYTVPTGPASENFRAPSQLRLTSMPFHSLAKALFFKYLVSVFAEILIFKAYYCHGQVERRNKRLKLEQCLVYRKQ
jgi:hypothetical protein